MTKAFAGLPSIVVLTFALFAASTQASPPPAEVRALAADQSLGFEQAELALERQTDAPDLQAEAKAELDDAFGGVWIDNSDGATVKLGVAEGEPGAVAEGIDAAANSGTGAEVVVVEHSFAELEAAARWLSERLLDRDSDLGRYFSSGIRTDRNAVFLAVPTDTQLSADQKRFVSEAESRLGSLLVLEDHEGGIERRSCSWPYCDPPLRGGTRLLYEDSVGLHYLCTGGFITRGRGPNNSLFLMTAGHCGAGQGSKSIWTKGAPIGPFHKWLNGGSTDAGIIKVLNEGYWDARSWVYVKGGSGIGANEQYPIYEDAAPVVGMQVCTNGGFTPFGSKESQCGHVATVKTSWAFTANMVRTSVCTESGDSGAPLFANNTAYGILSGGPPNAYCDSYFSEIQPAENAMNVDVTHAPKPPPGPPPVAPVVQTTSATDVGATQATLGGSVDPEGNSTQYYFEYGTTGSYGSVKPVPNGDAGSGTSALSLSTVATGLVPATTYHYRVVATNAGGTSYGGDQTLTTKGLDEASSWALRDPLAGPQWVYYRNSAGALGTWAWNGTNWLSSTVGGTVASGTVPTAIRDRANGDQWVYYVNNAGSLGQWAWNGASWSNGTFPYSAAANTSPSAVRSGSGTQWLYYVNSAGSLAQLSWNGTSWGNGIFNSPVKAGTSPVAIRDSGAGPQWVYYVNSSGQIAQWAWNGAVWGNGTLGGNAAAGTSPAVIRDPETGHQWIYYVNSSGQIAQWAWNGAVWDAGTIGGAAKAGSSPTVVRDPQSGHQWVYYVNSSGQIAQWAWNGAVWDAGTIGGAAKAGSSPTVVRDTTTGNQSVFYVNSSGGISEWWWDGGKWNGSTF